MAIDNWEGWLPLWAVFVISLAVSIGSAEAGAVLAGIAIRKKKVREPEAPLGALVGAMLGCWRSSGVHLRPDGPGSTLASNWCWTNPTPSAPPICGPPCYRRKNVEAAVAREYAEVRLSVERQFRRCWRNRKKSTANCGLKRWWLRKNGLGLRALFVTSLNELTDLHQSCQTVGLEFRVRVGVAVGPIAGRPPDLGISDRMAGMRHARDAGVGPRIRTGDCHDCRHGPPDEGLIRVTQKPIADVQRMMQRNSP